MKTVFPPKSAKDDYFHEWADLLPKISGRWLFQDVALLACIWRLISFSTKTFTMPKHTDYITKLPKKEWKEVRAQLASGTHVDEAKNYLSKLTDNIRIFVTDGEGFGDQMFVVNIIEQLHALGYKGVVEIIAHKEQLSQILQPTYQSALKNILKLYDVEHLFQHDFLFYTNTENITFHFYDYNYFNVHRNRFSEVEIALFPGLLGRVYYNYYDTSSILFPSITSSYFDVLDQLNFIAKSKKALYLNFYTAQFFENKAALGFGLKLQGQRPKVHSLSHALSYPKLPKPISIVQRELSQLKQKKPLLGSTLEQIIKLQEQNNIYTFVVYAVHHLTEPKYTLRNLLLSSKKAHADTPQPLLMLLLSPIPDSSWHQLQTVSQSTTVYLDIINGQIPPYSYDLGSTYVLRLPSIPWIPFDHLLTHSTYPPLYEGVNAALSLRSALKRGLPCPKAVLRETGKGLTTKRQPVADHFELPNDLALAGENIICPIGDFSFSKKKSPYEPSDYTAFLMRKYAKLSLPPGLPHKLPSFKKNHPEFDFNVTEALPPLQIGDDRLAFSLAIASQESYCEVEFDPEYCRTSSAIAACEVEFDPEYCHTGSYLAHLPNAALRGFGYGFLEDTTTRALKTVCRLPEDKAYRLARSCEFALQGYLNEQIIFTLLLLAADAASEVMPVNPRNKKWIQYAITTSLFMSLWLPQLFELDSKECCFSALLALLSTFTHMAGQRASQMLCQGVSNLRFFSHQRSPTPISVNAEGTTPDLEDRLPETVKKKGS